MSSLVEKLNKTASTKESIRQALISNGENVPEDTVFSIYAEKITSVAGIKSAYTIASSAPEQTNILWVDSTNNTLKYYNGSEWKPIFAVWGT